MAGAKKKVVFSDLDSLFVPNPITKQLIRKTNREAVKQSVKNLILTDYFERPFKSDIGCSIRYYLFELWSPALKQTMENAIREVIDNYEPRADVLEVLVEDRSELNALSVTVAFSVRNDVNPVVLNVILERVR
jgi:phage baseplate assembly protein W